MKSLGLIAVGAVGTEVVRFVVAVAKILRKIHAEERAYQRLPHCTIPEHML